MFTDFCALFFFFFLQVQARKNAAASLLQTGSYLDLDLVRELLQVPRQLPAVEVSGSERHLQARAASRPRGHHHAEVVLRLELHVRLKRRGRHYRDDNKIAALNQKKAARGEAGTRQRMMRSRHLADAFPTHPPVIL